MLAPRTPAAGRRYRCFFTNSTAIAESGEHPFVQLRAESAVMAAHLAQAVTGCLAVVCVQRLEEVAA